jgi:hypothetical protein
MGQLNTYILDVDGWRALDQAPPIILPPGNEPPTGITGLSALPATNNVQLTWTPSTDPEGGQVRYNVSRGTTLLTPTPITSASYTATGLAAGTSYSFSVTPIDDQNATGPTGSITVTTNSVIVGGFPDATNTGYQNHPDYPGSLSPMSGTDINTNGSNQTYSFMDIGQCKIGDESTTLNNVTFIGCRFACTDPGSANVRVYGNNITFQYCTFEPATVTAPPVSYNDSYQYAIIADGGYSTHVGALTVEYCNFWGFHDGIPLAGESGDPLRLIQHNYFHDTADTGGTAHVDFIGNLSPNGALKNVTINHNTMVGNANSSILGFQYGPYSNFSITNNLIGGGGYSVHINSNQGGIVFTDNTYTTAWQPVFGPLYPATFWTSAGGNTWRRNKWKVPPGAPWGTPSNDGKFWIPFSEDASSNGWDDNVFVSDTDYTG